METVAITEPACVIASASAKVPTILIHSISFMSGCAGVYPTH